MIVRIPRSVSLEVRRYRHPLRGPLRTAHGITSERDGLLLRLADAATGRVGFGEVAPVAGFNAGTLDEASSALAVLAAERRCEVPRCVAWGLGCALEALKADPSACAALPPVRSAALLPPGLHAFGMLPALLSAGFDTFKGKIEDAPPDVALVWVRCLLDILPPHARLRLDVNGAWDIMTTARFVGAIRGEPRIGFLEQPLPAGGFDAMRLISKQSGVDIALDETLCAGEFPLSRFTRWPGTLVVKPALCGLPPAKLREWIAKRPQGSVVVSTAFETAIGLASLLDLAATLAPATVHGFGGAHLFPEDDPWGYPGLDSPLIHPGLLSPADRERIWSLAAVSHH